MLKILSLTSAFTLLLGVWFPAGATDYITIGLGYFDLVDGESEAAQFSAEYRGEYVWGGLRPIVGISTQNDGGVYAYAGGQYDWNFYDRFYLIPNFVAGAYAQGDSKDLGHAIEFRSGIELDYEFENAHRVGVAFNHISNASIGTKNPGAETLLMNYSIPAGGLF
jgi:lipid A 3-O-deacylase